MRRVGTSLLGAEQTPPVLYVMFSSDGKLLATADQNSRTYLWDVATRTLSFTLTGFGFGSQ
jgi:WD40 repeat protein